MNNLSENLENFASDINLTKQFFIFVWFLISVLTTVAIMYGFFYFSGKTILASIFCFLLGFPVLAIVTFSLLSPLFWIAEKLKWIEL